ncbi:CamS family sex pheromone protein [Halolactibacillus sp. JCM 19043]|uniref:CamS family sex pheromone protein n=1 Tax=Halolactibacillus sp. JCM 19043 TaxID=1460638 RepID=UPI000783A7BF|nr:CamS family sex pheromone protein [Halolactibacillus sp. JCM 19043]
MKRLISMIILSIVVGCAPQYDENDEVIDETLPGEEQETAIIPNYQVDESDYQVLLPYRLSESRGVTTNQIANRIDIRAFENDLRRHSTDVFDPDDYFFQEGQQIGRSELYSWLERYSEASQYGLNPAVSYTEDSSLEEKLADERDNPKYLTHILEQNFLVRTEEDTVKLAGISLGIAMKSEYQFQTEIGGPFYYESISTEKMMTEAKRVASEAVTRLRQKDGLMDVPIMVAIYQEAARNSLVPGHMVAKTVVDAGSGNVSGWESIEEEYVLFPSARAREVDPDLSAIVADFQEDIREFFPNYVGLVGEGFYQGDQLRKLTLEIPLTFQGQAEINGFTQYVYGLVMDSFQTHYDLEVVIKSDQQQESLIMRERDAEKATVYIYE